MLSKLKSLKWPGAKSTRDTSQTKSGAGNKTAKTPSSDGASKQNASKQTADSAADARAALNDTSDKKRLEAVNKIDDTDLLLSVSAQDKSEAVRNSAARQYARHLAAGDQAVKLLDGYLAKPEQKYLAIALTAHHKDAAVRTHGSAQLTDDGDLLAVATDTRFHDTREAVTQKLSSIDSIDKCWRALKSKDKAVAKTLKARLDRERETEQLRQTQAQTSQKIIDEMEKLATGTWSPNFTTRFELFEQQWQQLDFTPATADKDRYQAFRSVAADKVAANRERQQKHDACQAIIDEVAQLRDGLFESSLETLTEAYPPARQSFADCKTRWRDADTSFTGFTELQQPWEQACRSLDVQLQHAATTVTALTALQTADTEPSGDKETDSAKNEKPDATKLERAQKKLAALHDWFKQGGDKTAYADELPQLIAQLGKEATQRREQHNALQNAIGRQFASLNSALASKRWGPARSIHERLAAKISKLPAAEQQRHQEKLARLEVKLNELGDWKQFATEPKLLALCEQMENIPQQGLAPRDQADRIKALQQQWKSMGASPALEVHWPRFKAAADTAYEPCAKYFAAKRDEKNSKLKRRSDVCEMLEGYLDKSDWQNADWKLVEKTLRTAKAEWRNTRVFDRKASAELDERFTRIVDALNEKLEPAYDAGAQEKTDLIEKVKVLAEGDINQHCINQVKRLQGLWRRTGITRQKDDKKLWNEFNQLCSEIFARHRGQQKEHYAASIQHVTRAKEIIRDLKQFAKEDAAVDDKQLQTLQEEFQNLPEFPERDSKYLMRDFNRAIESVEKQIQQFGENSRAAELDRIARNAEICAALERLLDQPAEQAQAESERLLADWDDGEKQDNAQWKKAIAHRRDAIVAHIGNSSRPDYEENTRVRRLLCIEAEILRDKPTPASDRDLRMQHQLEKLQTGERGNINHSVEEESTNLRIAWLSALPAEPADAASLEQRFNTALTQ
jgi:hypothetical protein